MNITLSNAEARSLVLHAQLLGPCSPSGSLLNVIENLGYVQIDTISVVERAHHHCLWNRLAQYQPEHLDTLIENKQVFEYWDHAAAYLPMKDYRFSLIRKNAISQGQKHWFDKDNKIIRRVRQQLQNEGPLMAKDFAGDGQQQHGWWDWKPAKKALEQLFMQGDIMAVRRQGFQKVYDLTERVLPDYIDTTLPSEEEWMDHLIRRQLKANGLATVAQIGYLRKGRLKRLRQYCDQMLAENELITINVGDQQWLSLPDIEPTLSMQQHENKVKILSPFDNLVIQRERLKDLFNFDYQIECYVPAAKRQYGYFCLPLLYRQQFAGRMDAKIHRKTGLLEIFAIHFDIAVDEQLQSSMAEGLAEFARFNNARQIQVNNILHHHSPLPRSTHHSWQHALQNSL